MRLTLFGLVFLVPEYRVRGDGSRLAKKLDSERYIERRKELCSSDTHTHTNFGGSGEVVIFGEREIKKMERANGATSVSILDCSAGRHVKGFATSPSNHVLDIRSASVLLYSFQRTILTLSGFDQRFFFGCFFLGLWSFSSSRLSFLGLVPFFFFIWFKVEPIPACVTLLFLVGGKDMEWTLQTIASTSVLA
ncbi:hypothetical protein B0T14DRAFT_166114 [Immersiella caudata]|uniref:Uncharacterized protein n=1 Tax=Immersiella caudata TaxID=314043 RepID=A0AA40C2P0_9PEZI|nr:hypothetical protein B0T14DRAFT_166114 [Immersiella caudata]